MGWFRKSLCFAICSLLSSALPLSALTEEKYISYSAAEGAFPVAHGGAAAPILVDRNDWPGVIRAASDLSLDIERVSGIRPVLVKQKASIPTGTAIIVGTIGRSALIDHLAQTGKIRIDEVKGKWEAAVTTIVSSPVPGVERALVIAGSDKRGTIYGTYDLSEQIGVSPWYWWADVRIEHHDSLFVLPGRYVQREPAVKYRGIFLNDEAPCLSGYAKEKFGGFNSNFYAHVFELLLRLKANYLWPAMWGNAFNEDDPENPKLADEYGIVMGTSHHEPMLRSQQEWKRHGTGPWDYSVNGEELRKFWRSGIRRNSNYESTVTLGMRGDGDEPMTAESNIALLEKIVQDQREILKQEATPTLESDLKIWALYKEVQDYYEKGMRVPDDVTLLWSDDNWGNIRRLPTEEERRRSGGAGIYYHFDYVGGPRSYKWINTNPITKIWEQMHLAYEYGATRLWIVNVGDLKPMEFPIEFFLSYARQPERWNQNQLHSFTEDWARRDFGPEYAEEVAWAIEDYTRLNGRRKPEQLESSTFSIVNFHEAERVEEEWNLLQTRVDALAKKIPESEKASYFELVQYPVDASETVTKMYLAAGRNALAFRQGRATTNDYAAETVSLFNLDRKLAEDYNRLLDGRWNHMMDQLHIGYESWNEPKASVPPAVGTLDLLEEGRLGVAVGENSGAELSLPVIDSRLRQIRSLTLFNQGRKSVSYHLQSEAGWLLLDGRSGSLDGRLAKEADIPVQVDWAKIANGSATATVLVSSNGQLVSRIVVSVEKRASPFVSGFIEGDGYVAIEASDAKASTADGEVHWQELPEYGPVRSAMTVFPVTAASKTDSKAALEYPIYLEEEGAFHLELSLAPSLNFVPGRGLRLAVSVDNEARTIVDTLEHHSTRDWDREVSNAKRTITVPISFRSSGAHSLKIWFVDPGVVLERLVLYRGILMPSYLGPPESPYFNAGQSKEEGISKAF